MSKQKVYEHITKQQTDMACIALQSEALRIGERLLADDPVNGPEKAVAVLSSAAEWVIRFGGTVDPSRIPGKASPAPRLTCPRCDRQFATDRGLKSHLVKFHRQ